MEVMSYVVDTVAFVKYLQDELPPKVDKIFKTAERGKSILYMPQIALGEFIYLSLKGRLKVQDPQATIREVLTLVETSGYLRTVDMDAESWEAFIDLEISELHDRMIGALAKSRGVPVITPDKDIQKSGIDVIWG